MPQYPGLLDTPDRANSVDQCQTRSNCFREGQVRFMTLSSESSKLLRDFYSVHILFPILLFTFDFYLSLKQILSLIRELAFCDRQLNGCPKIQDVSV